MFGKNSRYCTSCRFIKSLIVVIKSVITGSGFTSVLETAQRADEEGWFCSGSVPVTTVKPLALTTKRILQLNLNKVIISIIFSHVGNILVW